MRILGIETSCDETAICLVEGEGDFPRATFRVRGNALASQAALHAQYGGVFPNVAKREHGKALVPLLIEVLRQADERAETHGDVPEGLDEILAREPELLENIHPFLASYGTPTLDAIAVTHGPGLEPALWVGVNFAKALSRAWGMPLVAVNHMEGHVLMSLARQEGNTFSLRDFRYPMLALLISGGHTELVLSREFLRYERIGETRDDAVGEAFDKVARLLDLPYPGGPEISRLAGEARAEGLALETKFTRPMMKERTYDFSFSGLKTAVRHYVEAHAPLTDELKKKIAREFEETVADVLVTKTVRAVEEFGAYTVVVGGGVSANVYIRSELLRALEAAHCTLLVPPPELATDNALMIALAGYFHARKGEYADPETLRAIGNARLEKEA